MTPFLEIRDSSPFGALAQPHLPGFPRHVCIPPFALHFVSHPCVVCLVEADVVVARNHKLEMRIDALQHPHGGFVFIEVAQHGQVTAVEEHICLG